MYDKHPVYPHQKDLFWAYEPWKTLYVLQRIITTLLLVPCWVVYYGILPRSFRPRPSWSIKQIIVVKFTKRIYRVTEVAGVTWGTRDPTKEPEPSSLHETRFAWVPPLPKDLTAGIVDDDQVHCKKVGTYIWPRDPPAALHTCHLRRPEKPQQHHIQIVTSPTEDDSSLPPSYNSTPDTRHLKLNTNLTPKLDRDVEAEAADVCPKMIGIYLHGGGYCHMSAHEKSGTSRIPRRLMKDNLFQEIHAVEYRLLQHAPIPGAIQDAAAVYAHLVTHHLGATKGPDGKYHYPDIAQPYHTHSATSPTVANLDRQTSPEQILLPEGRPGVSRSPSSKRARPVSRVSEEDEPPNQAGEDGLKRNVTLSGNDADPAEDTKDTQHRLSVASRLRTPTQRPKIILIGDSAGGNLVLALARWIRDEGVLPPPDGLLLLSPSCDPSHTLPQVPASRRPRPHADTDYLLDTPEPRALLQRTFLGRHPIEMVYSPYVSPASEWVLSVFHAEGMADLEPLSRMDTACDTRDYREHGDRPTPPAHTPSTNPYIHVPPGMGLFTEFPRAMIVVGDAERLEREVVALEKGLERDGVRVRMAWAKDAVHDILMMAHWDEKVKEGVWTEIAKWVREVLDEDD
ncbi:alpha/beta-hydrolase [Dentipellis sp. KUC8613]|nr:alpha/beta-hydrolase [Dentipellis sp. KUC8613]